MSDIEQRALQIMYERDHYYDWADKLADAIASRLGVDIGEHSNLNCPWQNALNAINTRPQLDVEALKQIALEGVMKGREHSKDLRYIAFEIISESFNHMQMLGHFGTPLEKVEGLGEAIKHAEEWLGRDGKPSQVVCYTLLEAARKYHQLTEGK